MTARRERILRGNQAIREGTAPRPRRLEDGEVTFRIPEEDFKILARVYPELVSKDHTVRLAKWKWLRNSPLGEKYLVTRTPQQVKRSPGGIIIK